MANAKANAASARFVRTAAPSQDCFFRPALAAGFLFEGSTIGQNFVPRLPNPQLWFGARQPMLAAKSGEESMLHKSGVTESLARFIVATRWDDIPLPVRHQAKRSFMNFFAVALAGWRP